MQMYADHFSADPFRSYEFVRLRTKGLNIKTGTKQVWFYFICTTLLVGYMGNPYLNQATQKKMLAKIFPTPKKS